MKGFPKDLYTVRDADETRAVYADWAGGYDAAVTGAGYATPGRVAAALAAHIEDRTGPVMDFGCGTGLSGEALAEAGFGTIDGTDVTPEMLEQARGKGVYRTLLPGEVGRVPDLGGYNAVTATGVVSVAAAPPETLAQVLDAMRPGALLALSYNEPTLRDRGYMTALAEAQVAGHLLLSAEHGPHLPGYEGATGSTVMVLRRS